MPVAQLADESWEQFVRSSPALAGFWAEWSVPSQSLQPLLQAVAGDFDGRLRVGLVDHDAAPALARRYRIQGLPTIILFKDGAEIGRRVGLMDRAALHALVRDLLGG
jgi:thioredoxin-like negative regulator of GroEL